MGRRTDFETLAFAHAYNHPKEQVMRAMRFEAFGDPSVLKLMELAAPAADERTALVRVMAASINPSDVKNVAGAMKQTTLPRIPGRDFAGVVEAGPAEWLGAEGWAGDYRAAPIAETCGLGQAQDAYRKVAAGTAGRLVLRPQE